MSTAAAAPPAAKGGRKKLIIIIAAVLLVVLLGGGGALMLLKKPNSDDGDDGDAAPKAKSAHKAEATAAKAAAYDPKHPPVFVPLDPFTVNLADTDAERFAQIGVTLEIDDAKTGDQLKLLMPAVRNNILMVLSSRTAAQLLTQEGKEKLARSILAASVRPLGFQAEEEDDDEPAADDAPKKKKKKKRASGNAVYPVRGVHFSNFIVQ